MQSGCVLEGKTVRLSDAIVNRTIPVSEEDITRENK